MSTITVVSTGSKDVAETTSEAAPEEVKETPSEPVTETDETKEDSDTSEEDSSESESDEEEVKASADEDTEEVGEDRPKKKNGFKKRIDKLRKRVSDTEQQLEYWKQEAIKGKVPAQETKETKLEVKVDGKPLPDTFDTHEAYIDALTDWKLDQRDRAKETKQREETVKSEYQKSIDQFQTKVKTFKESYEDFEEVLSEVDKIPLSAAVHDILLRSKNGPELMYNLASNKEEFERINKLNHFSDAAYELAKFELGLKKTEPEEKEEKKTTKAPRPLSTVGKGTTSGVKKTIYDADKMSQSEYESMRREQLKAR